MLLEECFGEQVLWLYSGQYWRQHWRIRVLTGQEELPVGICSKVPTQTWHIHWDTEESRTGFLGEFHPGCIGYYPQLPLHYQQHSHICKARSRLKQWRRKTVQSKYKVVMIRHSYLPKKIKCKIRLAEKSRGKKFLLRPVDLYWVITFQLAEQERTTGRLESTGILKELSMSRDWRYFYQHRVNFLFTVTNLEGSSSLNEFITL